MKKLCFVVLIILVGVFFLIGSHSKFELGDVIFAQEDIIVVKNYNNWQLPKCTIRKGEIITVSGFSHLKRDKQPLIQLNSKSCVGWVFDDIYLNNKLK